MTTPMTRRTILQTAAVGAVGISPALRSLAYAAGSDAPEKSEVKIGFIPLTDCASVVMASVLGFDRKYGVQFSVTETGAINAEPNEESVIARDTVAIVEGMPIVD